MTLPKSISELKRRLSKWNVFEVDDNGYGGSTGMGEPAAVCVEKSNECTLQVWYTAKEGRYVKRHAITCAHRLARAFEENP